MSNELETCKQVDIPEVDNTIPACLEYENALCVIFEATAPFIGITTSDKSLKEVVDAIVAKLKTQSTLITNLQNTIADIEGGAYVVNTVNVDYTALISEDLIITDGGNITLYDSTTVIKPIRIKNAGATIITVGIAGVDTIEGDTSLELNPTESILLYPVGTDFQLI